MTDKCKRKKLKYKTQAFKNIKSDSRKFYFNKENKKYLRYKVKLKNIFLKNYKTKFIKYKF